MNTFNRSYSMGLSKSIYSRTQKNKQAYSKHTGDTLKYLEKWRVTKVFPFALHVKGLIAVAIALVLIGSFLTTGYSAIPEIWQFGDSVVYFNSPGCPDCDELEPSIRRLFERRGISLIVLDLSSFENVRLMFRLLRSRDLPVEWAGRAPSLFSRETQVIEASTIAEIEAILGPRAATPTNPQGNVHFTGVMLAGLVDGVNPCTLNVLLVLLSMCLMVGRKHTLSIGLTFVLGVVATYFIVGIGLGHVVAPLRRIHSLMAAIYLLYGVVLLYLGLFPPSIWLNKLKVALGKRIGDLRRPRMGYLAVFFLGVLCSGFEFVCTGQVYLPMVLYLATQQPQALIGNLVLYNFAFALPMLVMVGALHAGYDSVAIQRAIKTPVFARAGQVVMILLGVYLVLQGGMDAVNLLSGS